MKTTTLVMLLSFLLCARITPGAKASGFMVSAIGGDLAGPTEPNAAAIYWNPAAMGPIDGASLMMDLNFAWRTMKFSRIWPKDLDHDGRQAEAGTMKAFDTIAALGFTLNPGVHWLTIGVAAYAPFGHRSDWPEYDLEAQKALPEDNRDPIPSQAYHVITAGMQVVYLSPSISLKPLHVWGIEWLWLGMNISWVHGQLDMTRIQDFSREINSALGLDIASSEQMDTSGTVQMNFMGDSFAFSVGIFAQPLDSIRLGISWTSGSKLVLPGKIKLNLPDLVSATMGCQSQAWSNANLHMDLPPALRAGIHLDITNWLVFRINFEYVHWQLFKDIRIHDIALRDKNGTIQNLATTTEIIDPRNYENTFNIRGGFRIFVKPWWMIFSGIGYDSSAAPTGSTTPDLFDSEKFGLALGTWIRLVPLLESMLGADIARDDRLNLALSANWIYFLDRTVKDSNMLPPIDGKYSFTQVLMLNTNLEARF